VAIDRERTLAAAQKYVEKKRYDRAAAEYQRILQEEPNDARILLKLGDVQSKMESYADAVATYDRVGKFYAGQGFALKAIAVFKQIREIIVKHVPQLEEKYAHVTPRLAELYQQLGLTSDALAALDEVATRLQRQNRDVEAIEVFRKLVELDPTNPLPHLRLAEALSRAKDIDSAVLEFGIATGQLTQLGRRDDAIKVLERLLHHRADAVHARAAAELYLARGGGNDGMQALSKLQICFQANPRDLDTLGLLARAFTQIGQAAKAIEVQKEMARIARDGGQGELFAELVAKLTKLAPNDEGVQQLAGGAAASSLPPRPEKQSEPSQPRRPNLSESYEDVGDSDIETVDGTLEGAGNEADEGGAYATDPGPLLEENSEIPTAVGPSVQVAGILADAGAQRQERDYDGAIDALRAGLTIAPKSLELRQMLADSLLEADRQEEAVLELIRLAEILVEGLDGEAAARTLQDALALDPDNALATRMLGDLGYELVEEPGSVTSIQDESDLGSMRSRTASQDPDAPLPSYDLEEIGPDDVTVRSQSDPGGQPRVASGGSASQASFDGIDDPFLEGAPLPRFPLDGSGDVQDPSAEPPTAQSSRARLESSPARGVPELESALEEADFFASRGLFDDARAILEEQLARLPNHPLVRDRLTELDVQERSVRGGSGTRPSPAASSTDDNAFDIAESLNSLELQRASPTGAAAPGAQQLDVEEVFAQFKAGVARQIGADDAQSHYDLGVAYKEMGLLDDAIREFETAGQDTNHACVCQSMIGMIELERGNLNEAIDAFTAGLAVPERTKDQEATLSYETGAAYEAKKLNKQALDYFQRAARLAPSFRDVQERIRRLQKPEPKAQTPRAVAVGADDEFDRAFDDILGEHK
jgi:tetratricopeptide (TPR) repeat protein